MGKNLFKPAVKGFISFSLLFTTTSGFALSNNNVRVDRFKWMTVQTEHFDIYYDESTQALAPRMAHYLEKAWRDVGEKLNFQVTDRTPFFFFSNHNEFEQTNVVRIGEGTGGVAEAFKNRFLIFNDGSETWMKHVIYHEFGHVVQFNVLYGGFWKSIRLLKSPFYPLWLMEGMAEYVSGDVDTPTGEMVVRDAVYHDTLIPLPELQGFNHLKPNQVTLGYKTGEAAMKFLADEFGKDKVGELLVVIENHFDVSAALFELLGTDLYRFDFRFREWLQDKYRELFQRAKLPQDYGPQITFSDGIPQSHFSPVFSTDGSQVYMINDRQGAAQVFVTDLKTQKSKPLMKFKWASYENIHRRSRLSLSPDGRWLAFAAEKKQRDFLYLFDLKKNKLKKVRVPFDQIRSPVFSPVDNNVLACVGMRRGYHDLYLINTKGEILETLTNNPQDEGDPSFSPDGQRLIFSGEVLNEAGTDPAGRDLFELTLVDPSVRPVTSFKGAEIQPHYLPDGSLVYVRSHDDQGRVGFNLYHWDPSTQKNTQLTDFIGGGFSPTFHPATQTLYYVGFSAGERHLHEYEKLTEVLTPASVAQKTDDPEPENDPFWDDAPRRTKKIAPTLTRAMQAWPQSTDSSLFLGGAQPYRFQLSTDIFLPFFFYSTQDGFVGADIWQFSDTLGNHVIQQQLQYASDNDFVDLAVFYTYARFRPQFTVGFRTEKFFRDFNEQRQRREVNGIGLISYPFDRVNSASIGVAATDRKDTFLDASNVEANFRERFWLAGLAHDTVTGRYLVPTRGRRISVFYQQSVETLNNNQDFKSGGIQGVQYIPLPRESTFASRLFYGRSVGNQPQVFRLGGVDRIRGLSRGTLVNKKQNVVFGSAEVRLRLKYLSARTRFLFPDFFFKAAYLFVFDDLGFGWDNRRERDAFELSRAPNSAGVGISWPTFVLQTFQLNVSVQWAKRTDRGQDVWYITLGPSF